MIRENLLWRGALGQKLQGFRGGGYGYGLTTHQHELQDRREPHTEGLEALGQSVRDVECHLYHGSLFADALSLTTWVNCRVRWNQSANSRCGLRSIGD